MNVSFLCESITKSLSETFTVPTRIQRVVKDSHALNMRIEENQSHTPVFGFDLALKWRKLSGCLYIDVVQSSKGLAEQWRQNLDKNFDSFMVFSDKLADLHCRVWVKVDGKEMRPSEMEIHSSPWGLFSVGFLSDYVEVADGLDYHFDVIDPILKSFWAMILTFTSSIHDLAEESVAEGGDVEYLSKRYERNPLNRQACIAVHGAKCKICGMEFEKSYGTLGTGFIEVHHIQPLSTYGGAKKINPRTDLIPVCANCHAMLHRQSPPISPEALKAILEQMKDIKND